MENYEESQVETTENEYACKNCGSVDVEEGYQLALCKECRDKLSKRPLPLIIKLVALLTIVLTVISLINFNSTIYYGVRYERGRKAENAHKYLTAMKCYRDVVNKYPDAKDVKLRLYVAYYNNEMIDEACKVLDDLVKTKADDTSVQEANSITDKIDKYYTPSKGFAQIYKATKNDSEAEQVQIIQQYINKNASNAYDKYLLADMYFDLKNYNAANDILSKVLMQNNDFYTAYLLQAATYRELKQYDKAINCANTVLSNNSELTDAYVTLSKIELKKRDNKNGLTDALKAYKSDTTSPYAISNLSLAYHYNGDFKKRDEYFNIFKKLSSQDSYTLNLLNSIYSNKIQWQN